MIKINLATKKQGGVAGPDSASNKGFSLGKIDLEQFKELPIKKLVVPVVAIVLANYLLDTQKEEELKKMDLLLESANANAKSLQTQIAQFKETDKIKKSLDEDEAVIRTKLDTIKRLIKDRGEASSILSTVSTGIPKDVWLIDLKVEKTEILFRGRSIGFTQITDFMRVLSENSLFSNVELKNSRQNKSGTGQIEAEFELDVRRR